MTCDQDDIGHITILVVEDDLAFRFLTVNALLKVGFRVVEASDGLECLKIIDEVKPDLVLMDVMMPNMDGYAACKAIRSQSAYRHLSILMTTGLNDDKAIQSAYEAGATDFITKPINYTLLEQRIQYMIRNAQTMNDLVKARKTLTQAQNLAKLAHWEWDSEKNAITWSKTILNVIDCKDHDAYDFSLILKATHADDKKALQTWFNNLTNGQAVSDINFRITAKDGSIKYIYQQAQQIFDKQHKLTSIHATVQDVTTRHKAEEKIKKLAYFDPLTQLPNKAYFKELLAQTIYASARYKRTGALLFIAIKNLSRITGILGEQQSDHLFKKAAKRIHACVRGSDLFIHDSDQENNQLARVDSEIFSVVLPEISNEKDASIVASRLIKTLSEPFEIGANTVVAETVIGMSIFPNDAQTVDEALHNASIALSHARDKGNNHFFFFDNDMNAQVMQRMTIENELHQALANQEFNLVFQPQIDLQRGDIIGLESLIRWNNPTLGRIPPDRFIPIAEQTGQIVEIGEWVLHEACLNAKKWVDQGYINRIAVNVSVVQFNHLGFKNTVAKILASTQLPAQHLELEITETSLMQDADKALEILNDIKKLGVKLAIDDFGTGYSSLAYLKKYPIDHIKIDKTFVDDTPEDKSNTSIVKAVIAISQNLKLNVTAEGVETKEQADFLRSINCTEAQGYYYSKPVDADEITQLAQKFNATNTFFKSA